MKVALRTFSGYYVCAENGGQGPLVANRPQRNAWETFEVLEYPDNNIALIACNGRPVTAESGGGRELVTNRDSDKIYGWELFKVERQWQGGACLRCCNGQYLWAERGGGHGISATASERSSFTIFDIGLVPDEDILCFPGDGLWGGLDGNLVSGLPKWFTLIIELNPYGDNRPEDIRRRDEQRAKEEQARRKEARDKAFRENYNRDVLDRDSPEDRGWAQSYA